MKIVPFFPVLDRLDILNFGDMDSIVTPQFLMENANDEGTD
jgi:hypothetical protein